MLSTRVLILTAVLLSIAAGFSYEGFKVYKIATKSETENAFLKTFEKNPNFDFWLPVNKLGRRVSVMVSPSEQKEFENSLAAKKIDFEIQIDNVERTVQAEREYHLAKKASKSPRIVFDQYYRHDEMNAYLKQISEDYPDIVTLDTLGQSYEKREVNLLRISSGTSDPPKPVIFVDAGIHAEEWAGPAAALYLINQLVENSDNRNLFDKVDWIIVPLLNPDGYEYSWDVERFWRKTVSPGKVCNGTDPNRNFDFHWMESGATTNECDDIYAGPEPFSEVEVRNLANYLNKTENIKAYMTIHCPAQALLYPWGYDESLCDNWEELDVLGHAMRDAMRVVRGVEYDVASAGAGLYPASGASDDYSKGVLGIDIVYTFELASGGDALFNPTVEEMQDIIKEAFEGFKILANYVAERKG